MTKKKLFTPSLVAAALLSAGMSSSVMAEGKGFIDGSKTNFNFRYRLETVDQDGFDEDATASTLKARVTWNSGMVNGFKVNAELDHVFEVGADDYNDASGVDPKTQYPVVADPTGTDLNQLNISYTNDKLTLTAGRQRVVVGNQRFVGGVAWRQNEQTYDGVRANYKVNDKFTVDYAYVSKVNTIFGPDGSKDEIDGDFHLAHGFYSFNKNHKITGFVHLLDFDDSEATDTYGIDYTGKFDGFSAHAAFATQSAGDYDANYLALDATKALGMVKVTLGMERLDSDNGAYGFQTPLATKHKFQGWADKFLTTPTNGIDDYYVKIATSLGGVKLAAFYHDYSAVEGNADYGSEIDLVASYKVHKSTTLVAKYANYSADDHATDTTKFWFMANTKF